MNKISLLIIAFILLSITFGIGFYFGAQQTISFGITVASHFVNFTIDQQELQEAIFKYKHQIGSCYG